MKTVKFTLLFSSVGEGRSSTDSIQSTEHEKLSAPIQPNFLLTQKVDAG